MPTIYAVLAGRPDAAVNPGGTEIEKPMYLADMRALKKIRPSSQDAQVPSEVSMSAATLRLGTTLRLESQESLGSSRSSLSPDPQIKVTPKALFSSPVAATVPAVPATKSPGKTTWVDNRKRDRDVSPDGSVARMYIGAASCDADPAVHVLPSK